MGVFPSAETGTKPYATALTYDIESALAGNALLDGVSKAAVADCLYDLLPNVIGGIPVGTVKTWVSRAQFAQLVERVYLDFDFNYHAWLENMDKAFASWKQANQPV